MKVLERLVARQFFSHLIEWKLLPELQSAYRAYHSTEAAVFRVASDILEALDRGCSHTARPICRVGHC